jgi:branched-chain amino acid transport system ATP-binding protein
MLEARRLNAGYGAAGVLFDVELAASRGEVVALLGRNGAGKSTTLKTLMGLIRPFSGEVHFDGRRIDAWEPYEVARAGLGYVPEDRRIFTDLTVAENLEVGRQPPREATPAWSPEKLFQLFPALQTLQARRAATLSGGEQQMLCIARTLAGNPKAILLDEPSEGLAPMIVEQVEKAILELKRAGVCVLLSEQNLGFARRVANRGYVLEQGQMRQAGTLEHLELLI